MKGSIVCACLVLVFLLVMPQSVLSISSFRSIESEEIVFDHQYDRSQASSSFDHLLLRLMELAHIPSLCTCFIKDEEMVWSGSYGYSDIEENRKTSTDTAYLIASISKVVCATAVLQLVDQDVIDLSDDINSYLDFDLYNPYHPDSPLTFEMFLAHTASLDFSPSEFYEVYYNSDPPTLDSWMYDYFYDDNDSLIRDNWRNTVPGSDFWYSNVGYCVLARLVECITNMSYPQYCQRYIFDPLHMNNTSFYYSMLTNCPIAKPYVLVETRPYDLFVPLPLYSVCFYPAGGLWTTVEDLSHFLSAHMNLGRYKETRILSEGSIRYMHDHDLGWFTIKRLNFEIEGHSGGMFGYLSDMYHRTDKDVGIIIFINRNIIPRVQGEIFFHLIQNLLYIKAGNITEELNL